MEHELANVASYELEMYQALKIKTHSARPTALTPMHSQEIFDVIIHIAWATVLSSLTQP